MIFDVLLRNNKTSNIKSLTIIVYFIMFIKLFPTGVSENMIERYYYINDSIYGSFFHGVEEYGMKPRPMLVRICSKLTVEHRFFVKHINVTFESCIF